MPIYKLDIFWEWDWNDSKDNEEYKCYWREQQKPNADLEHKQK